MPNIKPVLTITKRLWLLLLFSISMLNAFAQSPREIMNLNNNWNFKKANGSVIEKVFELIVYRSDQYG